MSDTRTPQERAYDAQRDGSAYVKPQPPTMPANPSDQLTSLLGWIDDEIAIASELDRLIAEHRGEPPATLQITRHTVCDDGSIPRCPWTTYAIGTAEIDIHDDGSGGNLCLAGGMLEFSDNMQLLDLHQLLTNETLLEAIDPSTPGAGDGIDTRFDRAVDAIFDLPDHQRDQAIALWEGFLAGIRATA